MRTASAGKQLPDRNSANLFARDDDFDAELKSKALAVAVAPRTARFRVGIDFNRILNEIDNPVDGNLVACIDSQFVSAVVFQTRFGNLDDAADVAWNRVHRKIPFFRSKDDRYVRLGLTV